MSDPERIARPLWDAVADVEFLQNHPAYAAATLRFIFGDQAADIAAWCAIYARLDQSDQRYQAWLSAFKQLTAHALAEPA